MRYFSYNEPAMDSDGNVINNVVVTMSEEDIRAHYWPFWYKKMCAKYGQKVVDEQYNFEHCLADWIAVNWAWEV